MAVDEGMLDSAVRKGVASLRFYGWSEPTLSLGYFQSPADRELHQPSRKCPFVRRPSGGGAIVHDRELTYSLALPANHPLSRDSRRLYRTVHSALIESLATNGVTATLCGDAARSPANPPFLCFERRMEGDVLIGSSKIAGSAQRRRRGAVLQHGSILLSTSAAAPELPGIKELSGVHVESEQLAAALETSIAEALDLAPQIPADFL